MDGSLPVPGRSRAILIGVAHYDSPGLPDLPDTSNTAAELADALTEPGILSAEHVSALLDPPDQEHVISALRQATGEAQDLLVIYYSGHGVLDEHGELQLAMPRTDPESPAATALPFRAIRSLVQSSSARHRLIVLDCCISGRTVRGATFPADWPADQLAGVSGSYVIASEQHGIPAISQRYMPHANFTHALLDALSAGVPGGPPFLTVDSLLKEVRRELATHGLPNVSLQNIGDNEPVVLARNAAFVGHNSLGSAESPSARQLLKFFPEFRTLQNLPSITADDNYCASDGAASVGFLVEPASEAEKGCLPPVGLSQRMRVSRSIRHWYLIFVDGLTRSLAGNVPYFRRPSRISPWERISAQLGAGYEELGPLPDSGDENSNVARRPQR